MNKRQITTKRQRIVIYQEGSKPKVSLKENYSLDSSLLHCYLVQFHQGMYGTKQKPFVKKYNHHLIFCLHCYNRMYKLVREQSSLRNQVWRIVNGISILSLLFNNTNKSILIMLLYSYYY